MVFSTTVARTERIFEEPAWYALAGVAAFLDKGRELFHEFSKGHQKYTPKETDDKLTHALEAVDGPRTCRAFSEHYPDCPRCPHFGKLHGPAQIGIVATAREMMPSLMSETATDPGAPFVHQNLSALLVLREFEIAEYERVRAQLKNADVKLRALDAAMKNAQRGRQHLRGADFSREDMYAIQNGCISQKIRTEGGAIAIRPLCNFDARITRQVATQDDGAEKKKLFTVEGTAADGQRFPTINVRAEEFQGMSWIMPNWGTSAIIYSGQTNKDHLRAAIQIKSKDAVYLEVFVFHTGWRSIEGRGWFYLHGDGAIGEGGNIEDIQVMLGQRHGIW